MGATSMVGKVKAELAHVLVPRLVYGFELPALLRLLFRNRFSCSIWRLPVAVLAVMFAAFNTFLTVITRFVFSRAVERTVLQQGPVFVLGHWRAGTTFLHELLCCDPRMVGPTGYQCFLPGHFLFSQPSLLPVLSLVMPKSRPMDDMDLKLNNPQEDELAMLALTGTTNHGSIIFPEAGPAGEAYLSLRSLSPKARDQWLQTWLYFLKSVVLRAGMDRRLVLKSPQHTARVQTILQVFPDAKFVHIVRSPVEVYSSTLRTWRALAQVHGLQNVDGLEPWLEESVLRTFEEMYACFEEDRALVPDGNLVELRYEEFVADPKQLLAQLYEVLDLGDFALVEAEVDARLAQSRDYRPRTRSNEPRHAAAVSERWAGFIARYGYGPIVAQAGGEPARVDPVS